MDPQDYKQRGLEEYQRNDNNNDTARSTFPWKLIIALIAVSGVLSFLLKYVI